MFGFNGTGYDFWIRQVVTMQVCMVSGLRPRRFFDGLSRWAGFYAVDRF